MVSYNGKEFVCYLDLAFEIIRGKWKAVILCNLNEGSKRFLELQRFTGNISHKVLTEKLNELELDGLIEKKVFAELPPRVEYFLTERGKQILPSLKMIEQWAKETFKDTKSFE
ncbi:transcriptional regulator [Clostridium zeae]|uniref:Transcriptional regulator n=1 Tax=Clostridium zeae TaxID=2759022 RepID=A0ABQ1E7N2_9CLOT|nr:helix-turn-helix domain-containing protein [Clostridium zeae]GFZ30787.1 transcriptional regulator [Clostridium zeae]